MARNNWGFLTNHALVLIYIIRHNDSTVRDVSNGVGITERATLAILRELDEGGIVERHRDGRRNRYAVNFDRLAAYRREGTALVTPRAFIDGLITVLLNMAPQNGRQDGAASSFDSGALEPQSGTWGFLTNHALLLLSVAIDNGATVRELAQSIGVTERAVVAILNQLEDEGIVVRNRQGRRNTYAIDFDALRAFPRWSPGDWPLPKELIEMAVLGLRALAERSGAVVTPEPAGARATRRPHPLSLEWSGGS
jgi:DNA-binding MarR family transcriptional regulator